MVGDFESVYIGMSWRCKECFLLCDSTVAKPPIAISWPYKKVIFGVYSGGMTVGFYGHSPNKSS